MRHTLSQSRLKKSPFFKSYKKKLALTIHPIYQLYELFNPRHYTSSYLQQTPLFSIPVDSCAKTIDEAVLLVKCLNMLQENESMPKKDFESYIDLSQSK